MKKTLVRTQDGIRVGKKEAGACSSWQDLVFGEEGTKAILTDDVYANVANQEAFDQRSVAIFNRTDTVAITVLLEGRSTNLYEDDELRHLVTTKGVVENGIYYILTPKGKIGAATRANADKLEAFADKLDNIQNELRDLADDLDNA